MVKKALIIITGIIVVLAVGLLFLRNSGVDETETLGIEESFNGEVKEFDIIAKQWEFNPETIEVNKGDKVILNIESVDVAHGISIPDFKINERLNPGEKVSIEFIADKTGEFNFFCNVYCGEDHGSMVGKLVVN